MNRSQKLIEQLSESANQEHFLITKKILDLRSKIRHSEDPESKKRYAEEIKKLELRLKDQESKPKED